MGRKLCTGFLIFSPLSLTFGSAKTEELFKAHPNLLGNLPRQAWNDVTAGMDRHHRVTTIVITKVLVGAMVTDMLKAKVFKDPHQLLGLENIAVVMAHGLRAASPW